MGMDVKWEHSSSVIKQTALNYFKKVVNNLE